MKFEIKSGQVNKKRKMAIKEEKQESSKLNSSDDKISLNENQHLKSVSPNDQFKITTISSTNRENPSNNLLSKDVSNKVISTSLNSTNSTSNVLTNVTSTTNNNSVSSLLNLSIESKPSINSLSSTSSNLSTNSLLNVNQSLNLNSSASSKTSSTKFSIANILSSVKGAENVLKTKTDLLSNDIPADLGNFSFYTFLNSVIK